MSRYREGILLCVVSAAAYSTAAIFAKFAYRDDVGVGTLLTYRYLIASSVFWLLILRAARPLPARTTMLKGFLMGLVLYSAQALFFFSALERMDAAPAALVLYSFPAMVTAASILLKRERPNRRRIAALAIATIGVTLVLLAGGGGNVNAVGALLSLLAALAYTIYLLLSDSLIRYLPPLLLSTLVCTGAATTYTVGSLALGNLDFSLTGQAWSAIGGIALVSTVLAILTGFASLSRVGPSINSIVMTIEVPLTTLMAIFFLGEDLHAGQVIGAALILGAVVLLQLRPNRRSAKPQPALG